MQINQNGIIAIINFNKLSTKERIVIRNNPMGNILYKYLYL